MLVVRMKIRSIVNYGEKQFEAIVFRAFKVNEKEREQIAGW